MGLRVDFRWIMIDSLTTDEQAGALGVAVV